jgi:hypothetical protein
MTAAQLVVAFLNKHPNFSVCLKSSADNTENILAQRDLLLLVEEAFKLGHGEGYDEGHSAGFDAGYSECREYDT